MKNVECCFLVVRFASRIFLAIGLLRVCVTGNSCAQGADVNIVLRPGQFK